MIVREGEEEEMVGVGHKMSVCYDPLVNQWLRLRATEEDMIVLGFLAGSKATSELPQN
jgi:hypothetical protein